ncbi:MAG: hypothetical protein HY810_02515 [Candidatus Omnitrophica bacterium]|nr:hypothetical protein [Candidatus Omnitrophota bacterium]
MSKVKKLGKGLEDISHLFLSSGDKEISFSGQEQSLLLTRTKSICLVGNGAKFHDSFLVINLALALARLGMRIAVVDADEDLPCLNFLLGKEQSNNGINTSEVFIQKGPLGVQLVGLNQKRLSQFPDAQKQEYMLEQLRQVENEVDLIMVSMARRNLQDMRRFLENSIREFLVLVSPDKDDMLSAYAVIKSIFNADILAKIGVIITEINHMYEIDAVYDKLYQAVQKFLDKQLYKYGFLFKINQDVDSTANIASFYDADLTACISNIAQIVVLRLNLGNESSAGGAFFTRLFNNYRRIENNGNGIS